jgi:lipopolysaccharide/colanic/teichoic acid biosynthesis glycosyltransferase
MTVNTRSIDRKAAKGLRRRRVSPTLSQRRQRLPWLGTLVRTLDGDAAKRTFDLAFSLFVLSVFSPIYLILAVAIAVSSPGPIFYAQERVGKNYKRFRCLKFRTMVNNADEMLASIMAESPQLQSEFADNFKLKDDPRITPIGKFLRLTSLDEFPQFWNVLKGDMSVVGPRPLVPEELPKYGNYMKQVLSIRPGITGLWQVSGRNDIPYPRRVQIDVYYVSARSWVLDLWIIVKTIGVLVFTNNNGAY